jgi:NADH:ubiquinone oxidoreductase subunit 6 (subunit J)
MNHNLIYSRVLGNAQGLRVILVVVEVGAVKIYVAAVEVVMKKEGKKREKKKVTKNCFKMVAKRQSTNS